MIRIELVKIIQLTVNYRSRIFSAVVMGKAYYGLELVGGNKSHLAPLQTTINKGIRLFTGARLSTAIGPLLVENWDWVTSHSLIGITGTLVGAVCDQENTHQCHLLGTDNDVFTLNADQQNMLQTCNPKSNTAGKRQTRAQGAFTHRIREDGEIFSGEEGRETSSDTTPLASVAGSVRMRSTDSDRSVRATPKKARDASPPPQDDLWVVIKNLSQQVAAQQAEMDALRNAIALQQKATANLEKILGNMASQAASTVRRLKLLWLLF
ncbi:hypothetical protein BASA62_007913 [Batrachochytrium salamandrivorans]|nr:hypothetical protein BASA62_007913 [Batrachochytrium salamandrivorans]